MIAREMVVINDLDKLESQYCVLPWYSQSGQCTGWHTAGLSGCPGPFFFLEF